MSQRNGTIPIDFVVTWVDGSDPAWLSERMRYAEAGDSSKERFRDWDMMRYWFRGVEQFAPWVNKIHFVTWGHVPSWLNKEHPKLHVVRHDEFIPSEYLPTFSSHTIEWNVHRIEGLGERFVLFNDDMFLVRHTQREDFFRKGLPCGTPVLQPIKTTFSQGFFVPFANIAVLNKHFSAQRSVLSHPLKWLNPVYGSMMLRTLHMLPYPAFYGLHNFHMPNSFLKQAFVDLWNEEGDYLNEVCTHRFRHKTDANQWLALGWQFAKGEFSPRSPNVGKLFNLQDDCLRKLDAIEEYLQGGRGYMICINDGNLSKELVSVASERLHAAFDEILGHRCSFEAD